MRVINLFGGPGTGKSTTAAGLFFKMKTNGDYGRVELVTEFAKDMVYAGRLKELEINQLYITAKQYHKMERLRNQVDYIITDSPIVQAVLYTPKNYFKSFRSLLLELHNSFDNINIIINRVKEYKEYGRVQTEEKARQLDVKIKEFFKNNDISYSVINGDILGPNSILDILNIL
jgi:nicotinamide riboside kinase